MKITKKTGLKTTVKFQEDIGNGLLGVEQTKVFYAVIDKDPARLIATDGILVFAVPALEGEDFIKSIEAVVLNKKEVVVISVVNEKMIVSDDDLTLRNIMLTTKAEANKRLKALTDAETRFTEAQEAFAKSFRSDELQAEMDEVQAKVEAHLKEVEENAIAAEKAKREAGLEAFNAPTSLTQTVD
jgi:DNA repair exonuclease SbcCD nuclease subunit